MDIDKSVDSHPKQSHHLAATGEPLRPLWQPAPNYYSSGSKHYCKPPWPKALLQPHQPKALPPPLSSHLVGEPVTPSIHLLHPGSLYLKDWMAIPLS